MSVPDAGERARLLLTTATLLPAPSRPDALDAAWAALTTKPPGLDQSVIRLTVAVRSA
ncbi:hypothetical protein [Symbioplanes lichenis]|uniref:hypothetical protein n=1 Tax=Symbioplanes lichenis TaxID=1629072 RepID=UPI002738DB93|nr:hypothetical protein [Actinoplanes lichenis]